MEVAFTSDLHVDQNPAVAERIAAELARAPADVLILAGDVTHRTALLRETLSALRGAAPVRLFVPGNHDLWCEGGETSRDRYLELLPALCREAGWTPLHVETVRAGAVAFVGETGWYDYGFRNRAYDGEIRPEDYARKRFGRLLWMDAVRCRWPDADDAAVTAFMVERLRARLAAADAARIIAVTHFLPFAELVHVRRQLPWDFMNGFMGAPALGAALAADGRVVRAIAGHTHLRRSARVAGAGGGVIAAEVSPIGYPREHGGDLAGQVRRRLARFTLGGDGATRAGGPRP